LGNPDHVNQPRIVPIEGGHRVHFFELHDGSVVAAVAWADCCGGVEQLCQA
jgi:hypothetical protein